MDDHGLRESPLPSIRILHHVVVEDGALFDIGGCDAFLS
jgi:hypothetical protein